MNPLSGRVTALGALDDFGGAGRQNGRTNSLFSVTSSTASLNLPLKCMNVVVSELIDPSILFAWLRKPVVPRGLKCISAHKGGPSLTRLSVM